MDHRHHRLRRRTGVATAALLVALVGETAGVADVAAHLSGAGSPWHASASASGRAVTGATLAVF